MNRSKNHPDDFIHDEAEFRKRMRHPLVATNLRGAYTTPTNLEELDVERPSATELARHGIYWRRPTDAYPPALREVWRDAFSRKWLAKNRVVPHLVPQIGRTHLLRHRPREVNGMFINWGWAGAVIPSGSWNGSIGQWNGVLACWEVPTVSVPSQPEGYEGGWNSSSWIGLDGFGTNANDVLQAGVEQSISASGQSSYKAWFEWYGPMEAGAPDYVYQTDIPNFTVKPGHRIYCSVQYLEHAGGIIYFANTSTGQYFSITLAPPPGAAFAGDSVEWIMEAPDGGEGMSSLPRFTPVEFTPAIPCSFPAVINPANVDIMNIQTQDDQVLTAVTVDTSRVKITFIG